MDFSLLTMGLSHFFSYRSGHFILRPQLVKQSPFPNTFFLLSSFFPPPKHVLENLYVYLIV